jgi:CRP/FNR family cyclic AMP-dependent transcriptional regulator
MAPPAADTFRAHGLFADLAPPDAEAVAALARRRTYSAGTVIFQRGDPGREMILVTAGRIRLSVLSAEGRELGLRHAEPGTLIGEIALLDGGPRSADATAATDAEALVVSKSDLDRLIAARPQIALAFVRFLCARLRDTTEQLETVALYRLEARVARFLLGFVRQRAGNREVGGTVRFELPFNQTEIADVIGASRPKVNRAFADLEAAGAIARTDDGLVCRLARLSAIAEGEPL